MTNETPGKPRARPFNKNPFKEILIANKTTIHFDKIGSPTRLVQLDMKRSMTSEAVGLFLSGAYCSRAKKEGLAPTEGC